MNRFAARLATAFIAAAIAVPGVANAYETTAKYAYMIDAKTGTVLFDKNGTETMFPASMTKMMTIYLVFERLKDGRLTLDSGLPVSEEAWRTGGSKSFMMVGDKVRVEDLIRGVIVQSGNDACIVLAQGMAGSEAAFAVEMNKKAKELGMTGTNFKNSDGMPDPQHVTTARDLAILAKRTIEDFPEYYSYYAETEYTHGNIRQQNRNPLLYKNIGADGLKTGHTEASGYGVTGSAIRGGRRVIAVLNGMASDKERAQESERMIEWGFNEYENYTLFKAGEIVDNAPVEMGKAATVPLAAQKEVLVTLPRAARQDVKANAQYPTPLPAPITKGAQVGTLVISAPGAQTIEIPLVATADVPRLGFFGRTAASVKRMFTGSGSSK